MDSHSTSAPSAGARTSGGNHVLVVHLAARARVQRVIIGELLTKVIGETTVAISPTYGVVGQLTGFRKLAPPRK